MKNYKKLLFLFFNLVFCCQLLCAGTGHNNWQPVANNHTASYPEAYRWAISTPVAGHAEQLSFDNFFAEYEAKISKQVVKPKKKFKRIYNSSTRLRQPVKELDLVSVNIFAKETYNKPFFLSHLHHFLFRLTPF